MLSGGGMLTFPRWLKILLLLTTMLLLAGGARFYQDQRRNRLREVIINLESIAQLKIRQITDWREARLNDAAVMMGSPFYINIAERWLKGFQPGDAEAFLSRFRSVQQYYHYHDVLLVSTDGKIQLRLSNQSGPLSDVSLNALSGALRNNKPVLTDLYLDPADLLPVLDVIIPLYVGNGDFSKPACAILVQYNAREFLYPSIQSWPVSSWSAETLLVRRDGDSALFLNDVRHRKDTALQFRILLSNKDVPAVLAVSGRQGIVQGTDYRGVKVLAVLKAVPDTGWYMVAKEDQSEAFSVLRRESVLIGVLFLLLIVVAATILGVLWQHNAMAYYRTRFEEENVQRQIDERYKNALDDMMEGCQIIDFSWCCLYLNDTALKYCGHTKEEMQAQSLMELYPGIENTDVFAAFSRCMDERTPQIIEGEFNIPDGSKTWFEFYIQPVPEGILVLFQDISNRKRKEIEYNRLASAIAHSGEIVVITDIKGIIQYVNPAFETVTGFTSAEVVGRPAPVIKTETQNDAFYEHMWKTIMNGGQWRGRFVNRKKDGTLYTEEATVSPILNDEGAIIGHVALKRDISEYLKLQDEKEKLQAQFLQAQKMESVGRLAGGVAHDFNNMLSVILGHAQLSMDMLNPAQPLYVHLQQIKKAAMRSADLTRQLLAFARKQPIAPKVLDLNEIVEGLLSMLKRIIGEDIELAWMPGRDLWPVRIDPAQIDQILANLTANSRNAIEKLGKITIETENMVFDETYCTTHAGLVPGEYVMIALNDNGRGISKEVINHIFEPFYTTKEIGEGTGLGLATVYGIVKQNEGFISIYSEPDQGTTFKIYLPRYHGQRAAAKATTQSEPAKGGTETLLLVEDEATVLNLTKLLLERLGYTVLSEFASS
jgi:two-component system cell cycle sensor histidine kinase/response regulator CckA